MRCVRRNASDARIEDGVGGVMMSIVFPRSRMTLKERSVERVEDLVLSALPVH